MSGVNNIVLANDHDSDMVEPPNIETTTSTNVDGVNPRPSKRTRFSSEPPVCGQFIPVFSYI
jgi:hypothetical protein